MKRVIATLSLLYLGAVSPAFAEEFSNPVGLVAAVSKQHRIPEAQAAEQVQRIFATIKAELKGGKSVEVENFGRFDVSERKLPGRKTAAVAQNQSQKMPTKPSTRKYAKFTPAEVLKVDLNQTNG